MNNRFIKTTCLLSLMVVYIFIYKFYIFENYLGYSEYITAAFTIILTFLSILFFGYQKDKMNELKKGVLITEVIILLGFFSLYYGAGLFTGFLKTAYALTLHTIIHNILALVITITSIEIFRYVVINSNKENKLNRFITTVVIC